MVTLKDLVEYCGVRFRRPLADDEKIVFAAAGLAAAIFVVTGGRKVATPYWRYRGRISLTSGQSVLATLNMLVLGGLGAWALVLKFGTTRRPASRTIESRHLV